MALLALTMCQKREHIPDETAPLISSTAPPIASTAPQVPSADAEPETCSAPTPLDFFPEGTLCPDRDLEKFMRRWFSTPLQRMHEPALACSPASDTVYRLLVLPTWTRPCAIRVTFGEPTTLDIRWLDGAGGYDPGELVRSEHRILDASERERLLAALDTDHFWTTTGLDQDNTVDTVAWALEGRARGRTHVAVSLSLEGGKLREVTQVLTGFAGIEQQKLTPLRSFVTRPNLP